MNTAAGSPSTLSTVAAIFHRARLLPPSDRTRYLDDACSTDHDLRREVESLLASDGESFLADPILGRAFHPAAVAGLTPDETGAVEDAAPELDRYRVIRRLGAGGMGTVWEVEQRDPHRVVAVKVLRDTAAFDQAHLHRFRYEARALASLQHPAIVRIIEAGRTRDGRPFIAMERVEGVPLDQWAADRRAAGSPAAFRRAVIPLFASLADALDDAHRRGIVHRDLKPSNVLVDGSDQPRILDFGLARHTGDVASAMTQAGCILGTLPWMSPEQVQGSIDDIDGRSDVYALGVMLYRILTGRAPYDLDGRSIPEAARIICEVTPRPAGEFDRGLRGDLATILGAALEKDRRRRYPSAAALAEDLRRVLARRPISARRPSALYVLSRFVTRHRVATALGVLLAMAVIAFSVVGAGLYAEAQRERDRAQAQGIHREAIAYRHAIALAQLLYDQRDVEAMVRVLDACPPHRRRWEWGWLRKLGTQVERTVEAAGAHLVFETPNGLQIVTRTVDQVFIRPLDGSTPGRHLDAGGSIITALHADPSGRRLAAGDTLGRVHIFDLATGRRTDEIAALSGPVGMLAFDAAGSRLAAGLGFTPPAVMSAGGDHDQAPDIAVIDGIDSARPVLVLQREISTVEPISGLVFAPGDHDLVVSAGRLLLILDATTGESRRWTRDMDEGISGMALLPGSQLLVTGHRSRINRAPGTARPGQVRLWRLDPLRIVETLTHHERGVVAVAVDPAGRFVYSADGDDVVRVTAIDTLRSHDLLIGNVDAMGVTRAGDALWCMERDHRVRVRRLTAARSEHRLQAADIVTSGAVDGGGTVILTGDRHGGVALHRTDDAAPTTVELGRHDGAVISLAIATEAHIAVSGGADGVVRIWDLETMQERARLGNHAGAVRAVAISPDGRTALTGDDGGTVRQWRSDDPVSPPHRHSGHQGAIQAIAADWDRMVIYSGGADGSIRAWRMRTGACIGVRTGHADGVTALALHPSTRRLASGGTDGAVRTWSTDAFDDEPFTLAGHRSTILSLAFSPEGDRLASSSTDTTQRLWVPGEREATLKFSWRGRPALCIAFDRDGCALTAVDPAGLVIRRDALPLTATADHGE
ncbi:MAG: protein kinase [Phycisphaeraceae bacterium]|nr:protein kinase [Phycisphaeraceae bacterium]